MTSRSIRTGIASLCLSAGLASAAHGVAEDPASTAYYVYVTAESADEVYLVRYADGAAEVVKRIEVGYQPTEIEGPHGLTISPDGDHWFLTMAHGKPFGILYKYETGTDRLVGQCELGLFPATMQISEATGLLYCVNFDLHGDMSPSSVSIVDPEVMTEVERVTTGPMPHGSRVSPDGRSHYSCAMMSGELFEIDAVKMRLERVLNLDTNESRRVDHEKMDHAEKAHHGDHGEQQQREDAHQEHHGAAADQAHGEHQHAKSKPTWVYPHPNGRFVYVALNGIDQIAEVDLDSFEIVRRFETDKGPYNVEVSPDGKLFVATYKSAGKIGIWDIETGKELARLPTSRKVSHGVVLSPDSRFAFVSSEGIGGEAGTLDVYDLEGRKLSATAEVGLQAGGIYFWKAVPQD